MDLSYAHLGNLTYLEELYEQYLNAPEQLGSSWRNFFEGFNFAEHMGSMEKPYARDIAVFKLIEAYRNFGHLLAHTNPIETATVKEVPALELKTLGFEEKDLKELFPACGLLEEAEAPLEKIIEILKDIYCRTIGIEYMGCQSPNLEKWIQERIEPTRFKPNFSKEEKIEILHQLSKSELFETFLHTKYVGQKRFSLEGGETLIPILNQFIQTGSEQNVEEVVIGMSHRGRLNVLTNILNKPYAMVFSEFEDFPREEENGLGGDVKYHKGFSADFETKVGKKVHISLTANPSHLESVDAVVEGMTRAKQIQREDKERKKVIPVLIHGDASIAGQGEVYECLQLYKLSGYTTGGTLHIVVNNHIGFTTLPKDSRSTYYCTDIARAFSAPVFHVNAEDPEGCIYAAILALQIRQLFACDVFIDLNCYRKYGHNEGDEPFFTQPLEYKIIQKKQTIRDLYIQHLVDEEVLDKKSVEQLEQNFKNTLHQALEGSKKEATYPKETTLQGRWEKFTKAPVEELLKTYPTAVSLELIKTIGEQITRVPSDFYPHNKIERLLQERKKNIESDPQEKKIDWGLSEHLAFGTLLWEGFPIRLTGQDSERGTFSHRHAVLVDQTTGEKYAPLNHLKQNQPIFEIYNSPLSEYAVLGFEFGYSLSFPESLVIWEAQFGDFANSAQVVIDQYISCSEQKWARYSGIVLYLPHGYEGQGPEHSSARLERFLQLAGENNMQIVNPSTPAQLFHLLRRQIIRPFRKPLIIFTPKGLLRLPDSLSKLIEFSQGSFKEVIDDPEGYENSEVIVFCTGRIYYDLAAERKKRERQGISLIRIEQLYPWAEDKITALLKKYAGAKDYLWVQEEPINMGAWEFIRQFLSPLVSKPLKVIARKRSAAPAVGSHMVHHKEYEELMEKIFR